MRNMILLSAQKFYVLQNIGSGMLVQIYAELICGLSYSKGRWSGLPLQKPWWCT